MIPSIFTKIGGASLLSTRTVAQPLKHIAECGPATQWKNLLNTTSCPALVPDETFFLIAGTIVIKSSFLLIHDFPMAETGAAFLVMQYLLIARTVAVISVPDDALFTDNRNGSH